MAKQKCGTCRFFEEAGLAGSGWCHHPQRKVSSDVMIMVRRSELACRDDWAKSFWEPIEGSEQAEAPYKRPATLGPTKPASLENMRSLLQADTTVSGELLQGEDVLLSEGRIVSETHEPLVQPARPASAGGFDPRTAVMKAREAYRERARARDAAARHSAGAEAIVEPVVVTINEDVPAAAPQEEVPIFASATITVPESHHGLATANQGLEAADDARDERSRGDRAHYDAAEGNSAGVSGVQPREHEGDAPVDLSRAVAEKRHGDAAANESLPAWYRTDLPRVCRTCRDYRPASEGGRGWCANAWAFTHRRLVQEDDAAPCESSIGDWWAPVDDVWLVAADVSSHGRATPLLDRATGQERGQRRRS